GHHGSSQRTCFARVEKHDVLPQSTRRSLREINFSLRSRRSLRLRIHCFCTRTIFTQPLAVAVCTLMKPSLSPPTTTSSSPLARVANGLLESEASDIRRTFAIFGESTSPSLK